MTSRTWVGTILIVVLALLGLKLAASTGAVSLRSQHSEPAVTMPAEQVLIVEGGKVYHRQGCTYLHGEARLVPAADAVRLGYAPCVRCLHEILPH